MGYKGGVENKWICGKKGTTFGHTIHSFIQLYSFVYNRLIKNFHPRYDSFFKANSVNNQEIMIENVKKISELRTSQIIGIQIKNLKGVAIGKIENLMIDWSRGEIAYVLLSCSCIKDMKDILFAIPTDVIELKNANGESEAVMDIDPSNFQNAPGFNQEFWPEKNSHNFTRTVYNHYRVVNKFEFESEPTIPIK